MEFFGHHHASPTTISVNPPGGTGRAPKHTDHLPLPTHGFPEPVNHYIHATQSGHTALWIVFALFTAGLVGVLLMAMRVEKKARIFHWLSALVLTIAMISYFAMATGLGIEYVPIHYHAAESSLHHYFREVYYARYIDWLFTTPLLLISLAVLAGLSPYDTLFAIVADVFMIVTGLLGGAVNARRASGERARWGFFTVSCIFFLGIWWTLISGGLRAANNRPRKTKGLFTLLAGMTLLLWTAYPIVFALTEGANRLSVDTEVIAYAVLDVAAKLGFTFLLLGLHNHGDDDTWSLPDWFVSHKYGAGSDGRGQYGSIGTRDE